MNGKRVTVIGAGLAGCEAAWQLATRGIDCTLVEMKPHNRTPAHVLDGMAELVCSNSLRGASLSGAVGLLKEELRELGSLLLRVADRTAVPAGRALAVDRHLFSQQVEKEISSHPLISVERKTVEELPATHNIVVATGPLTEGPLLESLKHHGAVLNYHDAIAPLVSAESIDFSVAFEADRYEDPSKQAAYVNCPFTESEYLAFVEGLVHAEKTPLHDFETAPFFEGCLPVEEMARRGPLTLAHGPLKPVGLTDPKTGRRPFAVVQLRQEDSAKSAYNLVGFQTRLTRPEQRRLFRSIPGLANAKFERYGQVHRNTFVDAPRVLDEQLRLVNAPHIRLAGQLSGVEGYVESIASGFLAGSYLAGELTGNSLPVPPETTALGGLARHTSAPVANFQPSNIVWAMIETPKRNKRKQKKQEYRLECAQKALQDIIPWKNQLFG